MIIRKATQTDSYAVAKFVAMAESEMINYIAGKTDLEGAAAFVEPFVLSPVKNRYSSDYTLIAEIDGKPVGAAVSFPANDQPELDTLLLNALRERGREMKAFPLEGQPGTYYLSSMGVDPTVRGKGIGSALMTKAMEVGVNQGFEYATLLVSDDKPRARVLYERMGFTPFEDVSMADAKYCRMRKKLV